MSNVPDFDWQTLADRARRDGPGELLHYLGQYSAWFIAYRGKFDHTDYPAPVLDYLRWIYQPTGRRGRPQRTPWEESVVRSSYEFQRLMLEVTKATGGLLIDSFGNAWPVDGRPSELAISSVANDMHRSEGAALDAIFPGRKKKQRRKNQSE